MYACIYLFICLYLCISVCPSVYISVSLISLSLPLCLYSSLPTAVCQPICLWPLCICIYVCLVTFGCVTSYAVDVCMSFDLWTATQMLTVYHEWHNWRAASVIVTASACFQEDSGLLKGKCVPFTVSILYTHCVSILIFLSKPTTPPTWRPSKLLSWW
jgi:hypothetical protein